MANAANTKLLDDTREKISVFSFSGSVIIPTEAGSYFASAVGGTIASRPAGNPYILFSLKYLWDMGGQVSEFPEPILIRLNTAVAVTEHFDFKFPVFEPEVEKPETIFMVDDEDGLEDMDEDDEDEDMDEDDELEDMDEDDEDEDEDEDLDEGFIDDEGSKDDLDSILTDSAGPDELSW
jgi:hypothetical protein